MKLNDLPRVGADRVGDDTFRIVLHLNGFEHPVETQPWVTLLDLLREEAHLTGTKKGCDHGQCGACTVLLDGKRVNSCLILAVCADGCEVRTVEGLSSGFGADEVLDPLQQAFMDHDALQCGYCTPGQLCSARGLIAEGKAKTREEVRELMSGNLCRCGAYSNITDAVMEVLTREGGKP
ncbi:(2Fe-2S)-binding protein [Variovorax sp. J22R133]|uniref:(2Fe-2S)-binding protein n=1 Tax=Variovorax brevis TaxID=3053503 RepID=UPI002578EAF4|nr:(2Fe-2S)-binding protein [Variovorax sp. J22R133]MDM0111389.1 (2Fe-2S)-binding protein [Variovorax sp. J22R133]